MRFLLVFFLLCSGSAPAYADLPAKIQKLNTRIKEINGQLATTGQNMRKIEATLARTRAQIQQEGARLMQDVDAFNTTVRELTRLARHPWQADLAHEILTRRPAKRGILQQGQATLQRNLNQQRTSLHQLLTLQTEAQRLLAQSADQATRQQKQRARLYRAQQKYLKELKIKETDLAAQLALALPPAPTPAGPVSETAALPLAGNRPTNGLLIRRFNEPDETGIKASGMTVRGLPGGPVYAVHPGRVVFAGPFRDYGHLLIVENEDGRTHQIYGGITHPSVDVGMAVKAGAALGSLPNTTAPHLYYETRHNGQAIQPAL
jgi:septal ring factor EnvC (AmiA/AmiB activator)